ncbi:hypothetical protein X777_04317 [Ooceraea biroi]|uniref:USP domain-containing protein n=1 Tax=Ooceraea biroi TaxID=2015173 RepID=A0A026WI12_OOCBI|nr:hypothetical protein X777_04317 [Ooceraea biroi]
MTEGDPEPPHLIFPISDIGTCQYVNCETNVGYLAGLLFKESPSFEEISQCNLGCPPRLNKLSVIQMEEKKIVDNTNFNKIVEQSVYLKGEYPWDIIVFNLFSTNFQAVNQIKIMDISKTCINPQNRKVYRLIGIVCYKTHVATRHVQMGHYTAICLRAGSWIEYDDLGKKEKSVKESTTITPALLIYAK